MAEIIDPTLVAFTLDEARSGDELESRLAGVGDHYQALAHEPLTRESWLGASAGVVAFHDPVLRCAWPHWSETPETVLTCAYIPIGWQRITGTDDPARSAPILAQRLAAAPERVAAELNTPQALILVDKRAETLHIANDSIGAGRMYELSFPGGTVWSNRIGALSLFSGISPAADERGWSLFAAGGWFMGDSTPVRGARKLPPATLIQVSNGAIARRDTGSTGSIVGGGQLSGTDVERVAEDARQAIVAAGLLFPERPRVDLSGGRDSRISAAAAISAGVDVELRTSDIRPGEAEVARRLVELAPGHPDHKVQWGSGETKRHTKPLRERALNSLLLHDGMRYAGRVRGRVDLPPPPERRASISGHGGEIAHGFYYPTARKLRQAEDGGRAGILERLMKSCRRTHGAATDHVYELARAEFERSLDAGEAAGVSGPTLLDWFYLVDRFPHRSGLASHTQRVTVFSSPSFIRAAFTLTPAERLGNKLHLSLTTALVPEWEGVPYYEAPRGRAPALRRDRIWQGADRASMREMLSDDDVWGDVFDPRRVRGLWRRVRLGRARGEWEQVFERIACRVAFDDWARVIRERL